MGFFDSVVKNLPIVGDVLQGVGSVMGAMSGSDTNEDNRAHAEALAQHGIRWKVADAKAAGLHPLYALGASSPMPAQATPIDFGAMGQGLSRAASGHQERELQRMNAELLQAQTRKTEMETAALASDIAMKKNALITSKTIPDTGTPGVSQTFPVGRSKPLEMGQDIGPAPYDISMAGGPYSLVRDRPAAVDPRLEYMTEVKGKPAFTPYNLPGGLQVLLPSKDASEPFESMENLINQGIIVAANLQHLDQTGATDRQRQAVMRYVRRWIAEQRKAAASFGR